MKGIGRLIGKSGPLIGLVGLCALIAGLDYFLNDQPSFLSAANWKNVLQQVAVVAILAVGSTFVILTAGIDLSVGSVLALAGAVGAHFIAQGDVAIGVLVSLGLGTLLGLGMGSLVAHFQLPPFVGTLGMYDIGRSLVLVYTTEKAISDFPESFQGLANWAPVLLVGLYGLAFVTLKWLPFGRHVYAVGANEVAARLSGVAVSKIKLAVYGLSGFCAGLGGLVWASRLNSIDSRAGQGLELDAIAAVVIGGTSLMGGRGSVLATACGALILVVLQNGMNLLQINPFWQQAAAGAMIVLAVLADRLRVRAESRSA